MKTLLLASMILSALGGQAFAAEADQTPCTYALAGQVTLELQPLAEELKASQRERLASLQCTEVKDGETPKYTLVLHMIANADGGNLVEQIFLNAGGKMDSSESFYKKGKNIESRMKEFRKRAEPAAKSLVDWVQGQSGHRPTEVNSPNTQDNS